MEIIKILDKYIAGDMTGGNKLLAEEGAVELYNDPDKNVHKLLLAFKAQKLDFEILRVPNDLDTAVTEMTKAKEQADKYVYALYVLSYLNPISSVFVNTVLERIDAK